MNFALSLIRSFAYPFRGRGVMCFILGIILSVSAHFTTYVHGYLTVFVTGYMITYL